MLYWLNIHKSINVKLFPKDGNKQVAYSYFLFQLRFDKVCKTIQCKKVFQSMMQKYLDMEGKKVQTLTHTAHKK